MEPTWAAGDFGGEDIGIVGVFGGSHYYAAVYLCGAFAEQRSVGFQLKREGIFFVLNFEDGLGGGFLDGVLVRELGVSTGDADRLGVESYAEAARAHEFSAQAQARSGRFVRN